MTSKLIGVALLAVLSFGNCSYAENINPADYVNNEYGTGSGNKFYKFEKNTNDDYELKEVNETDNYDFILKYNPDDIQGKIIHTASDPKENIDSTFFNLSDTIGAAIYNDNGDLGNINGNFINNANTNPQINGAIFYNLKGNIDSVVGDFIGNHSGLSTELLYRKIGNTLYSDGGHIGEIKGNFIGNANYGGAYGYSAAIYLDQNAIVDKVDANFVANYIYGINNRSNYGGAIANFNGSTIKDLRGNFIGNYVTDGSIYNRGGAIDNRGTIEYLSANFIGNNIQKSSNNYNQGGAIYTQSSIGLIENSKFQENYIEGYSATGAAIYNEGTIDKILNTEFSKNYLKSDGTYATGGAIDNRNKINYIKSTFIDNNIDAKTWGQGGAIINYGGTINDIEDSIFINNYVNGSDSAYGGAITNRTSGTIGNISGIFNGNHINAKSSYAMGGAIDNRANITGNINGKFINNNAVSENKYSMGGAIYNAGTLSGNVGNVFKGNYAESKSDEYLALGGAIYTTINMNFVADNEKYEFLDNYTKDYRGTTDNAIFVATSSTSSPTLKFETKNGGSFVMKDSIDGGTPSSDFKTYSTDYQYNVDITGDGTGTYYMLNDIYNANVSFYNTTINTVNNNIHTYNFNSLALNGNTNFVTDVDLVNEQMDHIETGNHYTIADGAKLTVTGMNLLNDANKDKTEIFFAEEGLANSVTSSVTEIGNGVKNVFQTTAYAPIYKYDVTYKIKDEDNQGYFMFARHGGGGSDSYNPAVLAEPVIAQAGVQATLNSTINYSFQHADSFTKLAYTDRIAQINANQYAMRKSDLTSSSVEGERSFSSTDFNENLSYKDQYENNKGVWVRPYTAFESIGLDNGPTVNAISYGTLVGFDTDFHKLKHGWVGVTSGFVGYNGAHLSYNNVSSTLNGGILGATETLYKRNFWTALTATAGASVADTSTMYGNENSTSLLAGIASKTGYNFEFKGGKIILQPIWQMSYSMINTFNYTNAAGVKINSDPLHTIQLNPSIRLIGNLKHGWQPYASVGMVWNIMDKTSVSANGTTLPSMHIRPYVQYGVGLQKSVGERFTGFGQAMIHNGGRNGVALTFGARWALGKGSQKSKAETGKTSINTEKKVLKQSTNTYAGEKHVLK